MEYAMPDEIKALLTQQHVHWPDVIEYAVTQTYAGRPCISVKLRPELSHVMVEIVRGEPPVT